MGYTPAFDSLYDGTLCGRWPAAALFASLLPLIDSRGHIDMSPQAISARTGWPMDLLVTGLAQLQEVDPESRSTDEDGRRLILLDQGRSWGWRVVNHAFYREKARLLAKNAKEVEQGRNAERMADRRRPPPTASHTQTQTHTQTHKGEGRARDTRRLATRIPDDFSLTEDRRAVAAAERIDADRTFAKFCDHWRAASGQNSRKVDWDATWRNWCRREADNHRPQNGSPKFETAEERIKRKFLEGAQ